MPEGCNWRYPARRGTANVRRTGKHQIHQSEHVARGARHLGPDLLCRPARRDLHHHVQRQEELRRLLNASAAPSPPDAKGRSPAHLAVSFLVAASNVTRPTRTGPLVAAVCGVASAGTGFSDRPMATTCFVCPITHPTSCFPDQDASRFVNPLPSTHRLRRSAHGTTSTTISFFDSSVKLT